MVNDDIMDNSDVRRGKMCWYKLDGMERTVTADALLLENGCLAVLNRFFGHLPCYSGMVQIATEVFMLSMLGEIGEFKIKQKGLDHFTLERYNYTETIKMAYNRFCLSGAFAMLLAG